MNFRINCFIKCTKIELHVMKIFCIRYIYISTFFRNVVCINIIIVECKYVADLNKPQLLYIATCSHYAVRYGEL